MKLVESRYLEDGKGFNDGRPVRLVHIEEPSDYDQLLANIAQSSYYGENYLDDTLGYGDRGIKPDSLILAAICRWLGAKNVFEFGCGKADVLFLLHLLGESRVSGLDISREIIDAAPEQLREQLICGDLLGEKARLAKQGPFDLLSGFDIWEHLHPARLGEYLSAVSELGGEDALFFFIVPAFGEDRVFGEVFPLEFEENRAAFERQEPFQFFVAEKTDPIVPASGHLIWAPAQWWEKQFNNHGLVRAERLEKLIHWNYDRVFHRAQKSFFLLRKQTKAASQREQALAKQNFSQFKAWQLLHIFDRAVKNLEREQDTAFLDYQATLAITDNMFETMLDGFEQRLRPWPFRLASRLKSLLRKGGV